jgi:branched-chain amino acid transport system substrate-binding protein
MRDGVHNDPLGFETEDEPNSGWNRRDFLTKTGRTGLLVGGALSFPSVLAACGGDDEGGGEVKPKAATPLNDIFGPGGEKAGQGLEISDGMMLAMTGQGSFFGRVMSRGAKLGAAQIEASGGPKFEISIADHESGLIPPAVTGVRRLITQDSIVTLQTSYGAPSEAIIPLLQQNQVLSFNGGGSSPGQVGKDFLWQTRMLFAYDPADGGLAYLAREFPEVRRLALVGTEENGVEAFKQKVPRIWPQLVQGGEIVAREIHEVGLTEFGAVVARIKSSGADAVFTVSFGNDLGYLVKQLREANVDIPVMGIEFTDQACKIAGDAYDTYMFATDHYDPANKSPWNVEYVKAHKAEYGDLPEYYGTNYYEQAFVIWELVRRVIASGGDPESGADLQKALMEDPEFKSLYGGGPNRVGTMRFDPKDHTIDKAMGVFSVKDCKTKLLAPIKRVKDGEDPRTALEV